jgi:hypothetical protein
VCQGTGAQVETTTKQVAEKCENQDTKKEEPKPMDRDQLFSPEHRGLARHALLKLIGSERKLEGRHREK